MHMLVQLRNALFIAGGVALLAYGGACLLGVDHLVFSKYTPGARDSWGVPVLLMLIGGASVLYGWFDLALRR